MAKMASDKNPQNYIYLFTKQHRSIFKYKKQFLLVDVDKRKVKRLKMHVLKRLAAKKVQLILSIQCLFLEMFSACQKRQ